MYSFHKIKAAAATLMVGFLLAIVFAATAQATTGQQFKAEQARADAANRYHHLGPYSPTAVAQKAEERRAQAMNRYYLRASANVRQAEKRRADATNRFYHLGRYAVIETSSSFRWSDAGIGAGAMLGTILLAGGLAVALRRRGGGKPSLHSTT